MVKIKRLLDLLSGVVALLSLGPVLAYLDRPVLALLLFAIPAGYWFDRQKSYPLPTWLVTLIAISGMVFYAVQINRENVAIPLVHAMVVLLAIRLLTPKEGRDYLQIFVLALFLLAGSSLIHLEVIFVFFLILQIFGVTLGLVLLTVYVTDQKLAMTKVDLVKLVKIGLILPALSLVMMLVFFVILPRTSHPLWNFLNPSTKGEVGLAESVQPGSFSQISSVKALAFRAEGPELALQDRYWRALVLNQFDDGRWVRVPPPAEGPGRVEGPAQVSFKIYPEPRKDRYLVTLDRPTRLKGVRHHASVDQMFVARSSLNHRIRLQIQARPGGTMKVSGTLNRNFYLQDPGNASARMHQVAASIRESGAGLSGRMELLGEFFLAQELSYAQDDLPFGSDAIDSFLFDKKRGYCEFFASAYVTLARLVGIPARLVGGYYGGEYNPLGSYYLVSEDAAHVWVEVLTEDNSWLRVDPSQWAINAGATLDVRGRAQLGVLRQMVDSLNYYWVQAVVVFDLAQQVELFRDAGKRLRSLRSISAPQGWWMPALFLVGLVVLCIAIAALRRKSKEQRLLEAYKTRLKKRYGDVFLPGIGLAEIGEQLDNDDCRQFAQIYYGAVFRDRRLTQRETASLQELLKRI